MNSGKGNIDLGNESELQEVFSRHYHALCYYAGRLLRENEAAAKDIVQDVFVSIWNKKLVFRNASSLKSYLYYSVYHSFLDTVRSADIHRRHHRRIMNETTRERPDNIQFLHDRMEAEVFTEIFEAIEQLPDQCRRVFKLSYLEGMSVEEVAGKLDISVNTVKSQRTRARKLLKERLRDLYSILAIMFFG